MPDEEKGFTLTITGVGPWERRATEAERLRMAVYVKLSEEHSDSQGRCGTCAFRSGTDANGSSLVVRCVDMSLQSSGTFGCHSVAEGEEKECVGYAILKRTFMRTE